MRILPSFPNVAALVSLLLPALAAAHPFLDVQPFPPADVQSGSTYVLDLVVFPGDTPVESVQLDFELSSPAAFGTPSAALGDGFSLVYDPVADPTHFSIVGDFTGSPLEAFGIFTVADVTMQAGLADETLSLLHSSVIVALLFDVPQEFSVFDTSNVPDSGVVAHVVPEPTKGWMLGVGLVAVVALPRRGRRTALEAAVAAPPESP